MKGIAHLGFYGIGPDYQDLNYLVALNSGERPAYFKSTSKLIRTEKDPSMLLIIRNKQMDTFRQGYSGPWQEIAKGKLGHKECVALWLH
jgi:hypothetical protein